MLTWTLDELAKYKGEPLKFSETIDVFQDVKKRTDIINSLSKIFVSGELINNTDNIHAIFSISGTLKTPSTRSLEEVEIEISEDVDEFYILPELFNPEELTDKTAQIFKISDNKVNLLPSVVDNIILSVPTKVLTKEEDSENVMPQGDGWEVISENDLLNGVDDVKNPEAKQEFSKLQQLFNDDKLN